MSKETTEWLNRNILIGNTAKRGKAWHYAASSQGDEPNHYDGFIPVGDVKRRLFSWEGVKSPIYTQFSEITPDGVTNQYRVVNGKIAITRSDTGEVLGLFSDGYEPHQYGEWLLNTVSSIITDTLNITSAGLLKNGAVAWVEIGVPEPVTTPEGVTFLPNLLNGTSFDGSIATFFKRTAKATVCDNTFEIARRSEGEIYKVKHTRNSGFKLHDARNALCLTESIVDDFSAEIAELCQTNVSDKQFESWLELTAPTSDIAKGRSLTMAQNKQDVLRRLWSKDERVSPWKGTAFGVLQASNTYLHHEGIVRGAHRAERNALNALNGTTAKNDEEALALLGRVLATV
jgi:phage/plasmid-like protein (TIGR03299 family)